jgi:hypothetical protein
MTITNSGIDPKAADTRSLLRLWCYLAFVMHCYFGEDCLFLGFQHHQANVSDLREKAFLINLRRDAKDLIIT